MKTQKTVILDPYHYSYCPDTGRVQVCDKNENPVDSKRIQVGELVVLVGSRNINRPVPEKYGFAFGPNGVPGNSDPNICRFHGWRGTWNDVATYAYGQRRIIRIRQLKNGDIAVTVGPDLNPNEP